MKITGRIALWTSLSALAVFCPLVFANEVTQPSSDLTTFKLEFSGRIDSYIATVHPLLQLDSASSMKALDKLRESKDFRLCAHLDWRWPFVQYAGQMNRHCDAAWEAYTQVFLKHFNFILDNGPMALNAYHPVAEYTNSIVSGPRNDFATYLGLKLSRTFMGYWQENAQLLHNTSDRILHECDRAVTGTKKKQMLCMLNQATILFSKTLPETVEGGLNNLDRETDSVRAQIDAYQE